jgi:hypothetical protein
MAGTFLFADGSGGHLCDMGSAPAVGETDVLCINSNTVITAVSSTGGAAWSLAETNVNDQGTYIYIRQATGGEPQTVTITTTGDHDTHVGWSRWPNTVALDISTSTRVDGVAAASTPAHSTGTLSSTGQLVIAFGALHSIGLADQNTPVWSAGFTELTSSAAQGSGATGVRGYVAYKENAGTAAETPQVSWSGANASDRYMLTVSFTISIPASRRRRKMATYIRGTEGRLNDIMTVLGTTKPSLWPFWEASGGLVSGISVGDLVPSETAGAAEALEDDFAPLMLPSGLYSYHFHPTGDHHLAGIDSTNYSFGDGSVDAAFSVGAWVRPNAIVTNVIMGKYDSAGNLEEWRFFIDSNGKLSLELHDASASATEIAVSDSALTIGQWIHVVATYDGGETSPVVLLYINGTASNGDGPTTESGTYTAMENTAAPLTVGCSGVTATPVAEFHGRIAMPFLTGKALTAAEVQTLYGYTAPMVGVC